MSIDITTNPGSAPGQGAAIPLRPSDEPTPHLQIGPYILIIDDELGVVDMLGDLLAVEGWQTVGLKSPMAAWTFLKHSRQIPSLILLDLMMPAMPGTEFLIYQHIDAELKGIPVILMSAGVNLQQLPQNLDVVAFLPKPFNLPQLFDLCATYCPRTLSP